MKNKYAVILSALNTFFRDRKPVIKSKGKNEGTSQNGAKSRADARLAEEMVTNAISTGNIATYDPLLSARPLDPRLEKMLQSLDGGDSPAKEAVKKRIIMAWNRLHGARAMAADQGTSGDA